MTDTIVMVLGLAVIDSINPSALVVALYLLSQPSPAARVLAYVGGIAVSYLSIGVGLMLGVGAFVEAFGDLFDHPAVLTLQAVLGAALLVYAIAAPSSSKTSSEMAIPPKAGLAAMAFLGMTVTVAELTTAFPYFGAVAVMVAAELQAPVWLPLLVVYNAVFVAPPLALLGLHVLLGRRMEQRYSRLRERLRRTARETMLWIMAIVGVGLLADALGRFAR